MRITLHPLDWRCQHRFVALSRREHDWLFLFDGQVRLVVACLWRLVEDNRIQTTSHDDGQQFGLPIPVDSAVVVNSRLANAFVVAVDLREGTLDLQIAFNSGHTVEIIPDSSGYEAWNLFGSGQQFIAVGGGDLAVAKSSLENGA